MQTAQKLPNIRKDPLTLLLKHHSEGDCCRAVLLIGCAFSPPPFPSPSSSPPPASAPSLALLLLSLRVMLFLKDPLIFLLLPRL